MALSEKVTGWFEREFGCSVRDYQTTPELSVSLFGSPLPPPSQLDAENERLINELARPIYVPRRS